MSTATNLAVDAHEATAAARSLPYISIVMPVRNEAAAIANTVQALLRQDYPADRFEVIVLDGESTDTTREIVGDIARHDARVTLLPNPQRWSSAARNIGIRAARGELILIVDGHCDLGTDGYLGELAAAFARTGADCIGRPQPLETTRPSSLQQAIGLARSSRLGHHPASYVFSTVEQRVPAHSVAVAYRRELFARVGLFDESFDACEDVELNHRVDKAGLHCSFIPALRISYHPRATLAGLFRQMARYGRGRVRLLRKHPETFSPLGFAPAVFLAFVLLGPWAGLWSRGLGICYLAALSLYGLAVLLVTFALVVQTRRWSLCGWLPLVFVTLHCGAGAGILCEAVQWRPTARRSVRPLAP